MKKIEKKIVEAFIHSISRLGIEFRNKSVLFQELKAEPEIYASLIQIPIHHASLKTKGATVISIEAEEKPRRALYYIKRYNKLVEEIATTLKKTGHFDTKVKRYKYSFFDPIVEVEKLYIKLLTNVVRSTIIDSGRPRFVIEFLKTGKADEHSFVFLISDVSKELGINTEIGITNEPQHQLFFKTEHFFFEPFTKEFYPIKELKFHYPYYRILKDVEIIPTAYYHTGLVFSRSKYGYKKAMESYIKALEICPEYEPIYYHLGRVYYELGEYEKAIDSYTKAIEINPKFTELYYRRSKAYRALGMAKEAEADRELYERPKLLF